MHDDCIMRATLTLYLLNWFCFLSAAQRIRQAGGANMSYKRKKHNIFTMVAISAPIHVSIINSSAIESRDVELFKTSKNIQKVHRSSDNDHLVLGCCENPGISRVSP